jgi:hypothetical protein
LPSFAAASKKSCWPLSDIQLDGLLGFGIGVCWSPVVTWQASRQETSVYQSTLIVGGDFGSAGMPSRLLNSCPQLPSLNLKLVLLQADWSVAAWMLLLSRVLGRIQQPCARTQSCPSCQPLWGSLPPGSSIRKGNRPMRTSCSWGKRLVPVTS